MEEQRRLDRLKQESTNSLNDDKTFTKWEIF